MNKFKNTKKSKKSRKNRKSKRIYGKGNAITSLLNEEIPKDNKSPTKKGESFDIEAQLPITNIRHESVSFDDNDIEKGFEKKPIIIIDNNSSFDNLRPIESDPELSQIMKNQESMFPSIWNTDVISQTQYYEGKRQIESPRHANERRPSSRSKSAPTVLSRRNENLKLKEYLENLPQEAPTFGGKKRRKRKTKRKNKKKRKTRKNNY